MHIFMSVQMGISQYTCVGVSFLFQLWSPEIELRLSVLCDKWFYLLSHLYKCMLNEGYIYTKEAKYFSQGHSSSLSSEPGALCS